jgi:DNA-binding NarL/FixJ family response regulator
VLVADSDEQSRVAACLKQGLCLEARRVATGNAALEMIGDHAPTLVVLEVELEEPSGYELCRKLREQFGDGLPIVFVSSTRTHPNDEIAALLIGADDYFIRPLREERFLARVRRLLAHNQLGSLPPSSPLTDRERQVLGLMVDGRRAPEIAELLCITRKTVATHIEHILPKLGAHNQAQAVAFAVRDRLVSAPSLRVPEHSR